MMHAGYWFLILLILNTLTALLYLIWYLVFKQDKDNRIQYIMHTIVMIICPLVGPLYFLLGFLKYHFMKLGERDLSDVEFAKKRHVSRVKADEERERNIVPIEEAISISDQEKKRENMLNVLLGETDNSLASISVALDSDDSEVAHYAASFLQSKMDEFREHVRQAKLSISSKDIKDEECQEEIKILIGYMNHTLKQNILTSIEQEDYVHQKEVNVLLKDKCRLQNMAENTRINFERFEKENIIKKRKNIFECSSEADCEYPLYRLEK